MKVVILCGGQGTRLREEHRSAKSSSQGPQ